MNATHFRYVIVGSGGAGSAAALAIREQDKTGSILLFGQESSRPYVRPELSHAFLRREKSRGDLSVDPVGWYAQHKIEMRTGRRATHLDTPRRALTLDNGETISFEKLLLATGASPKPLNIPGSDLPNLFYLRTLDDVARLHNALDKVRSDRKGRIAIIGGGLLGVEVAAALQRSNLSIDLITAKTHLWAKLAGENIGRLIARTLAEHGVTVHLNSPPVRLEGDGRVQRVVTPEKTLPCDLLIVAAGVMPNRELLRGTPIRAELSILVDGHCHTNVPEIFAAGDCAAVFDPLFGKHRQLDHWDSARKLGTLAGTNMAGGDVAYGGVSHFQSTLFNLSLDVWGEPRRVDHRLIRGNGSEIAEIGIEADGRVTQVIAAGLAEDHAAFQSLVGCRANVNGREETLKDIAIPVGATPASPESRE